MRPAPAVAVPLVLVPALGVTQGGFSPDAWVWAGALAAWGAGLAVVVGSEAGALRRAWPWLACAGALLVWTLASALWSAHAEQSVLEARRTLVYAAVLLALLALTRSGTGGAVLLATHIAVTALLVYALARYLLGARHELQFEGFFLTDPIGYSNATGVVAAVGVLLGLGLGSRADSRRGRAAAAATVPLLMLALVLTGSDGAWLALAVGLAVATLVDESPLRLVWLGLVVAAPSIVLVLLGRRSGLTEPGPPRIGGTLLALAAVGFALAAAALAARLERPAWSLRRPPVWAAVAAAGACVAIVVGVVLGRGVTTEPRASYYHVAWHDEYTAHPVLGSGAGTFALYWTRSGRVDARGGALDAHSLYLETLAELGPIGLALLLATLLYPLRAALAGRRGPAVPAATAAYAAFLVHAGLDWDWELPAVVVVALACAVAIVSSVPAPERRLDRATRAAVLVAALALGAAAIAGAGSHAEPGAVGPPPGGTR